MDDPHAPAGRWTRLPALGQAALLAVGYLIATAVAVGLTRPDDHAVTLRLSAGVVLLALLATRPRRWPLLLLATAAAGTLYRVTADYSSATAAAFLGAELVASLAGATVIRVVAPDRRLDLTQLRDAGALVAGMAGGLLAGSVTGAVLDRSLTGDVAGHVWVDWPLGSALGILVVVPLAAGLHGVRAGRIPLRRPVEGLSAVAVTAVLAFVGFRYGDLPMMGVVLLPALWAALRSGLCAAALALAAMSLTVLALTTRGHGVYASYGDSAHDAVLAAQVALLAISIVLTSVAALVIDRQHVEAQVRAREDELRLRDRLESLGAVAGGVAHDFNNMLAVVRGHAERALLANRRGEDPGPALEELLRGVDSSGAVAGQLVAIGAGRAQDRRPLDASALVCDVRAMLLPVLPGTVALEAELGPGALEARVAADPTQLQQALVNLVLNARDALPAGGTITLGVRVEGERVVLEVRDSGCGMDAETLARATKRGFTTKAGGTGQGLANVHAICEVHDGTLELDSAPGLGTTVRLCLPRCEERPVPAATASVGTPARGAGETVLLAEDNEQVRALMRIALSESGYRLLEAADGQQALELARSHGDEIDLLVCDVTMPGLDGPEVVRRLEAAGRAVRVLFVSGAAEDAPRLHGIGPQHVLAKPFGLAELADRVREELDRPDEPRFERERPASNVR